MERRELDGRQFLSLEYYSRNEHLTENSAEGIWKSLESFLAESATAQVHLSDALLALICPGAQCPHCDQPFPDKQPNVAYALCLKLTDVLKAAVTELRQKHRRSNSKVTDVEDCEAFQLERLKVSFYLLCHLVMSTSSINRVNRHGIVVYICWVDLNLILFNTQAISDWLLCAFRGTSPSTPMPFCWLHGGFKQPVFSL